jgi:hypothetical protein
VLRVIGLALAAAAALATSVAFSSTAGERCAAVKLRLAGQKANGKLRCHARSVLHGTGPDAACLARTEAKFLAAWTRVETRGGCATMNDAAAVEQQVDAFVDGLVGALPASTSTTTSTTITPTTSCPPLTALYCGINACPNFPPFVALCPTGMTCQTIPAGSCECVGDPIPCGSLNGNLCRWGTCPPGQTCGSDPNSTVCPRGCGCQ